jgi:repressor LexA
MPIAKTSRQTEVLEFIICNIREHGYAPSIREICLGLGLRSTSTVHYHLTALAKKGLIQWEEGKNRAITVLEGVKSPGLPIVGRIAAGRPIEAITQADEYLNLEETFNDPDLFVLRVRGDSMIEDHIADGDLVIIRKQETARDGEIVVALVGEGEATLKRFYREGGGRFRLQPANAEMAPIYVEQLTIQGKVVGLLRKNF